MNKDMRRLVRQAVSLGATAEQHRNHIKVRCPNGRLVIMSVSPSDQRAVLNARARLRRQGGLSV